MDDDGFGLIGTEKRGAPPLPRATLKTIIQGHLKTSALRCDDETIDAIGGCCQEFIKLVSLEASSECTRLEKSIISPDVIFGVLQKFEFGDYIREAQLSGDEEKGSRSVMADRIRDQKKKLQTQLKDESQTALLKEKQMRLFSASRQRMLQMGQGTPLAASPNTSAPLLQPSFPAVVAVPDSSSMESTTTPTSTPT